MNARQQVLIVDDYPGARYQRARILLDAGFDVADVETGEAAMQWLETRRPSLIVLDVHLPGMSGYSVCRALKQDAKHRAIPVVLITAGTTQDIEEQARACGADRVLFGDVTPERLVDECRSAIAG